ncbi:hypothetical protein HPB51_020536 [Rhipicephalus microplus]|uniref:HTH psq-type domain-containing protein n=1 Tax=Rhipicephalus microplus TaxID=6941 RepID=A0A9J6EV81_RHIMP|nr:hypothetical protein HPB51_020536 [Rhipicephalus microplus]
MSRKRKALSFKEKLDILRKFDEDPKRKRTELAKELGLATSTLSTVVGQRETIMKNVLSFNVNAKQAKTAQHVKLEETLLTWFKEITAAGVNIDGKVLREKADEFALALHIDGFQASVQKRCPQSRKILQLRTGNSSTSSAHLIIFARQMTISPPVARTVEDIVEEATCGAADSSDDGDDIDVGDGEGPPLAAETLHALDVLRRAVAADEVSGDTCRRFYAFEQSLLGDLAKKKRQKDIRLFHQEINAFYVLVPG